MTESPFALFRSLFLTHNTQHHNYTITTIFPNVSLAMCFQRFYSLQSSQKSKRMMVCAQTAVVHELKEQTLYKIFLQKKAASKIFKQFCNAYYIILDIVSTTIFTQKKLPPPHRLFTLIRYPFSLLHIIYQGKIGMMSC